MLFLFVVMMLDIKQINKYEKNIFFSLPISISIGLIIFLEIYLILFYDLTYNLTPILKNENISFNWFNIFDSLTNIEMIGQLMYTYYFIYLMLAGLILLIAMIGSIVLTMTTNFKIHRQQISEQVSRNVYKSYFLINTKK